MPRNGAGVYSLVNNTWYPPVNGVLATSTDWNTFITDVQSALTQSVSSDGQTTMTGNLPMGNNKITGLANGTAATDAAAFGQIAQIVGQCQLTKSGANLILLPYNGNKLFINGVVCSVPAAGVTLAATGLTPGTTYYIYAVATGTTITSLEASTTVRVIDATYGNQIKTGDATRALVGMARPITGPAWVDTATQRLVISWFNRQPIYCQAFFTANRSSSAAGYTDVNAEIHNEFLCWSGSAVSVTANGGVFQTTGTEVRSCIGIDGGANDGYSVTTSGSGAVISPVAAALDSTLTEGFHTATLLGANTTGVGTLTYIGSGTPGVRTTVQTIVQG